MFNGNNNNNNNYSKSAIKWFKYLSWKIFLFQNMNKHETETKKIDEFWTSKSFCFVHNF